MKKVKEKSNENCHFLSREKSLYVAWACFRNALFFCQAKVLNIDGGELLVSPNLFVWVRKGYLYLKANARKHVSGLHSYILNTFF